MEGVDGDADVGASGGSLQTGPHLPVVCLCSTHLPPAAQSQTAVPPFRYFIAAWGGILLRKTAFVSGARGVAAGSRTPPPAARLTGDEAAREATVRSVSRSRRRVIFTCCSAERDRVRAVENVTRSTEMMTHCHGGGDSDGSAVVSTRTLFGENKVAGIGFDR